jgi:glycosyltransferase involved in cell wall biosynthesis
MAGLVSILIPAYNAEKWIKESIVSAQSQTWPRKEIIIVDDGSIDNTLKIAKLYESKFIKVITQKHRGGCSARNKAYSSAQGDYIQWLDADDLLAPDKISEQMKFAENDRLKMTLYSSQLGLFYWRPEKAKFIPSSLWKDLTPVEFLINKMNQNDWLNPGAYLVSRRLSERAGSWDERLVRDQDGEFFCRIVAACERVKFVQGARCYYRRSGHKQVSQGISEEACRSVILAVRLIIGYLRSSEDSERTRQASLAFLGSYLPFFYLRNKGCLNEIQSLILELGGDLVPGKLGWKFSLIQTIFGFEAAKKAKDLFWNVDLGIRTKWDEIMFRITK